MISVRLSYFQFVIGSISGFVAGPTFDSIPVASVIPSHIAYVVIDSTKDNYFYRKQVMTKDLTNFKLYIKNIIQIRGILFGEISKAWNYMLSILDEIQRVDIAKDLSHLFILLAKKMENRYHQFSDLIKHIQKKTGMVKDIITGIITRFCPNVNANK